jgi:hypothetical protein
MKALLLIGLACVSMLLTGCHTVGVVDHGYGYGHSGYYRSGYSHPAYYSRSSYYGRRPYYGNSNYYGTRYHTGYYGNRYYDRGYYGTRRSGATVVIH